MAQGLTFCLTHYTSYETSGNDECRMTIDEWWNRFAQSFFKNNNDRIPYFDIHYSLFDIRYSLFQSFFFHLTGRFSGQRRRSYETTNVDGLINNVVAGFIPA